MRLLNVSMGMVGLFLAALNSLMAASHFDDGKKIAAWVSTVCFALALGTALLCFKKAVLGK